MSCTFSTIRFMSFRLIVLLACYILSISGAVAADNWFQSGYKALSELLSEDDTPPRRYVPVRLKDDGRPYFLHRFPSERSAISARLYPPVRFVEILRGCIRDWCHVRMGSAFGWLKKDQLELYIPEYPQADNTPRKPNRYTTPLEKNVESPVQTAALPLEDIALSKQKAAVPKQEIEPVEMANIPLPVRKSPAPFSWKLAQAKPDPLPAPKTKTSDKVIVQSNKSAKSDRRDIKDIEVAEQKQSTGTTALNFPGVSLTESQLDKPEKQVASRQEKIGPPPPAPNTVPPRQENAPIEVANIPLPAQNAPAPAPEKLARLQQSPEPSPKRETREQEPIRNTASATLNRKIIENIGAAKRRRNPVVTSLKLSEIKKEKYSLAQMGDTTFLPVREDHAVNARILGGIPFFANDVEALGLCIDGWCLVEWDRLRGWIKRRHLSKTSEAETPMLKLKSTVGTSRIPVFKKPDENSDIASYLLHPATSIAPIGECNQEWCNIRYSDATGWVRSDNLTRQ